MKFMSIGEAIFILGGQAVIFSVGAAILYRLLRTRLEKKIGFAITQAAKKPRRLEMQIFINSLPKVGSTTINRMLQAVFPQVTIEHGHFISREGQLEAARDLEGLQDGTLRVSLVKLIPRAMAVMQDLDGVLATPPLKKQVYFICGTRDPIAWALSSLFELTRTDMIPAELSQPENARRVIMDWFSGNPPLHWLPSPREWMQREIEGLLGVDPMTVGFDQQKGYQIVETKRGRLLLVRLESFDKCLPTALAELLSVPAGLFKLVRANRSAEKNIGIHYQSVEQTLRFPASFLERVYSDPYAVTFYSPEERRAFAARWSE
jgi:hypothetical protein